MEPLLSVDHLVASYGAIRAVHGISLEVREGELVALLGVNGAGKSTTLKSICGVLRPVQGTVTFAGEEITNRPPEAILKKGIALVPEGREIFGSLTVAENLRLGAFAVYERNRYREDLKEVFALFPILEERLGQAGGLLSGGEQQMLAIARGLMSRPKLLMLDEPSLGLAPILVEAVFATVEKIIAQGLSILLVEQNIFYAIDLARRCYLLENGKINLEGPRVEFMENPRIKEAYLGM